VASPANTATEHVTLAGDWTKAGGTLRTRAAGARLKAGFTGNQIDLIGRKMAGGGTVKVLVDGVPGGQTPVFLMNFIQPNKKNAWRIPHAVDLGASPVPQTWTITVTSDTGDYCIAGSVTGSDGTGNLTQPFVSRSGQIGLDPKFWRAGRIEKKGPFPEYGVAKGDTLTFDVYRSALDKLSFKADRPAPLVEPLVRNLPNGRHTVEVVATGDGEVVIEGLYVYEPPEKD
jgi:hypothetical protein